jgi:hypothetical protein
MGRALPVLLLISLLLLAGTAMAGEEKGTSTIPPFESVDVRIDNSDGTTLKVSYDVELVDGHGFNVFFVDESDWEKYSEGQSFEYYVLYSVENTSDVQKEWNWDESGVFYVIIDNSFTDPSVWENITVDYKVSWEEWTAVDWIFWGGLCFAIVIVLVILSIFLRRVRRKPQAEPPAMTGEEVMAQRYDIQSTYPDKTPPTDRYGPQPQDPYDPQPTDPYQPPPQEPGTPPPY